MTNSRTSKERAELTLKSQEHYDLMAQFERTYTGKRFDKEPKSLWPMGVLYQDGQVNELFLAYRMGYAFCRALPR